MTKEEATHSTLLTGIFILSIALVGHLFYTIVETDKRTEEIRKITISNLENSNKYVVLPKRIADWQEILFKYHNRYEVMNYNEKYEWFYLELRNNKGE